MELKHRNDRICNSSSNISENDDSVRSHYDGVYTNGFTFEILYLHTKNESLSNFGLALVACVAQSYCIL